MLNRDLKMKETVTEEELLKLAVKQGKPEAQYNLAVLYRLGQGVPQDFKEAIRLYALAADQGLPEAQSSLGYMYTHGIGVQKDLKKALELTKMASDQGYAQAQYNLAILSLQNHAILPLEEVFDLLKKASDQGHMNAQYNLGVMYYKGEGVKKDDDGALRLFKLAADQGEQKASEILKALEKMQE